MGELGFLVVGHICRDVVPGGYRLGGAAAYAAVTALRLGLRPGVVTRAVPQHLDGDLLQGVQVHLLPSQVTTTFENVYRDGRRVQRIHAVAGPIAPDDVPRAWHQVPIALLAPLAQEVHPRLAAMFPGALVGVAPQGWMRQWDDRGWVRPAAWEAAGEVLPHVRAVVLSEEDLGGHLTLLQRLAQKAECVVCTRGAEGATLHVGGEALAMPPRPAREVDPTGAGDVFAAAFLVRLWETDDPVEAARFANAVASFSVEGVGPSGVPWRRDVEAWLAEHSDWGWPQGR
ncbi:MAG: ribokinase [Anaerolineae bacterium]|nr:ribokinase [Anaerolineae bacterium]